MDKIEVALTDSSWLEGNLLEDPAKSTLHGVYLNDVFRSKPDKALPIGKTVFVPYSNILFIILEQ